MRLFITVLNQTNTDDIAGHMPVILLCVCIAVGTYVYLGTPLYLHLSPEIRETVPDVPDRVVSHQERYHR